MTESEYTPKLEDYRKISRPKAEKLFNEGVTLYLLPCKCSRVCLTETCGISPTTITKDSDAGRTFKKLVDAFEYYNCNREIGYYTHFYYVREENKTASKSTVSVAIVNGIPIVNPNHVPYASDEPVEYEGKEYGGFYLSYNNHDTDIYGCDTTAIVIGQMQRFFILNGNHSEALVKAAREGGFDACLNYFREHEDEMNERSDKPLNNEAPKR